jgi:outer membrane protein OmpA-like peptidoglycan-associated protein
MKRLKILAGLLCASGVALAGNSLAANRENTYEISPFAGIYLVDPGSDLNDTGVLGLRAGKFFTNEFMTELSLAFVPGQAEDEDADSMLYQPTLDFLYHFDLNDKWTPYIACGLGGIYWDTDGVEDIEPNHEWTFAYDFGAGIRYLVDGGVSWRLDLREIVAKKDGFDHNFMATLGLAIPFGGKPEAAAPPPPPPADSDKDGVIDANDKCPGTPAGEAVDASGCSLPKKVEPPKDSDNDGVTDPNDRCPNTPAGAKVDAAGCPIPVDSDKDGVIDANDKCPGTATGVTVDAAGCPLDSDKDGVIDASDKCPNTPAGAKVDAAGCPIPVDSDKDGVIDANDKCPGTAAGVAVDPAGCPLDSDKDGVVDASDKCPNTPAGAKVDAAGCPIPVDSDKDGVIDASDKCPNTPAGVAVDAAGCPKDTDKDGLFDGDETGKYGTDPLKADTDDDGLSDGEEVNKYSTNPKKADTDDDRLKDGEEIKRSTDPKNPDTDGGSIQDGVEVFVAGTDPLKASDDVKKGRSIQLLINFDTGSDVVKDEYLPKIEEVANFLKEFPEVTGVIEGHTDSAGSDSANMDLSTRRAQSVVKILKSKYGIAESRVQAKGFGESTPAADNATPEGRAKNRRIMSTFEYK